MVGGPHTKLSNLPNAQDATLSNILLDNFIAFYDWGFLDRGSFYNIKIHIPKSRQTLRESGSESRSRSPLSIRALHSARNDPLSA